MATWDLWMPDVLVHATSAPDPLVRQALNRAAREFFRRTRAWKEWMDGETTEAGTNAEYSFSLPTRSQIVRPEQATKNGKPLAIDAFTAQSDDWTQPDSQNSNQAVVTRDLITFNLTGVWAAGDVVRIQASFMPTLDANGIPDHLASRYLEPITAGALSKLLMTAKSAFYKPDLAGVNRSIFEEEIAMASVDAWRGHTNHVPRATPSWC